jgi:PAS domain S-box-containing protein
MIDDIKSKDELIKEIAELQKRNRELEKQVLYQRIEEERKALRAVINAIFHPIFVKNNDYIYTECNDAFSEYLGLKKEDIIGKTVYEISPEENAHIYHIADKKLLETGNPQVYESIVIGKDKTEHNVIFYKNIIKNTSGEVNGIVGFIVDITEQKKAEEEKRKIEIQLLKAQKLESLGVMAGGIAHDFNNILVGILGFAELTLLALPEDSPFMENIQEIMKSGMRAKNIIKQILTYTGQSQCNINTINLTGLIKDMDEFIKISISKKSIIKYELKEDLPVIEADEAQISQIIMNLVINSSEAIGDNNGIIIVRTGYNKNFVYFEVKDTGCGIPDEIKNKIFDPFFSTKFTGRGLGLAAVQGIIKSHKASINVKSTPGKGTIITVSFPRT